MGSERDEVLSLDEDDDGSFSGFSPLNEDTAQKVSANKRSRIRAAVQKKSQKDAPKENCSKNTGTKVTRNKTKSTSVSNKENEKSKQSDVFDISRLSETDICSLREVLGIQTQNTSQYDNDFDNYFGQSVNDLPNIRVELDSADVSDGDNPREVNTHFAGDLSQALFEEGEIQDDDDNEWTLPRLKTPEKGKAISSSLAKLINMACTSQCDTESFANKYKVPENCDQACPPLVNQEIWKVLDKRAQSQDRGIVDIQNLVASGMTPIIKLAEILKPHIVANNEAKTLLSDALTLMGQVQYNLSIRRRYMIRPNLKKKYHSLCNISTPISTKLFGNDVAKDIKNCDSVSSIGKEQSYMYRQQGFRGRGASRYPRRGYGNTYSGYGGSGYGGYQNVRFQPYPQHSQRGQFRPGYRTRGPKKSVTATATAPNDQS